MEIVNAFDCGNKKKCVNIFSTRWRNSSIFQRWTKIKWWQLREEGRKNNLAKNDVVNHKHLVCVYCYAQTINQQIIYQKPLSSFLNRWVQLKWRREAAREWNWKKWKMEQHLKCSLLSVSKNSCNVQFP